MDEKLPPQFLAIAVLIATTLACAGPFAAPTPDLKATVAAALAATQTAQPTDTPIPTPAIARPTRTPTPTSASRLAKTPAPDLTATSQAAEAPTVLTSTLPSGWILYSLPDEGFEIALPAKWQQLDLGAGFLEKGLNIVTEQNPKLKNVLSSKTMMGLAAAGIKFYALDLSPESLEASFPASANVLKLDLGAKMSLDAYVALNLAQVKKYANTGTPITHRRVSLANVEAEEITYDVDMALLSAEPTTLKMVQYIAVDGTTVLVISLGCPVESSEAYTSAFEDIARTFRLIKQE